jgi:glycosyltransferase involved in cell wall biosynthesis
LLGSTYQKVATLLKENEIIYLSNKSHNELHQLYNCADYFISLSLFHDEDFGCAPIESAFTGLPLIMTEWGGYKDISKNLHFMSTGLNVHLSKSRDQFEIHFPEKFELKKTELGDRKKYSLHAKSIYGINAIKNALENFLNEDYSAFEGFHASDELKQLINKKDIELNLYIQLYQSFWNQDETTN